MNIRNVENNQSPVAFSGAKQGRNFRRIASELITDLNKADEFKYLETPKGGQNLRARTFDAITNKSKKIGDEFVIPEDVRLHSKLKNLFAKFEKMNPKDDFTFFPRKNNEILEEAMNTKLTDDPILEGLANIKGPRVKSYLPDDFHSFVANA